MTRTHVQGSQGSQGSDESLNASPAARARAPYCAPKLRHLGSVRELTLGGTMGKSEGFNSFMMM